MKYWKRTAAWFMVLCILLVSAACGQSSSKPETDTKAEADAEEPSAETPMTEAGEPTGAAAETGTAETAKTGAAAETAGTETAAATAGTEAAAETAATGAAAVTAGTEAAAETGGTETAASTAAGTTAGAAAAEETADPERPDYAKEENWAYFGIGEDKEADLFLVCPTVDMRDEYNMSMDDEETKGSFYGALNMERGIYEDSTRMYAPYYRQAAMKIYDLTVEERQPYLELAYSDVSDAFAWYLENENEGRPIILAGFSQGADMCYRLMEEYFGDADLSDQLVAVYAIGWPCTREMVEKYPQIVPAQSEDDFGAVVSFECEAPELEETFIVPAGTKSYSINPLNWKTDGTIADKSENIGACFTSYGGEIQREEVNLCGCYIEDGRGALKVTDVTPADFPPILSILPEGSYHLYDYQFFFRNLQENVAVRLKKYLESRMKSAA